MIKFLAPLFIILLYSSSLIGQVVINEFCSSNNSLTDENYNTPDWIELYNYGSENINLLDYALSDDSTITNKWTFPDIDLEPNKAMLIYASGLDKKVLVEYINLINHGDEFSYTIGSSDIPSNWKTLGFDDSSWGKGPSGFGYGDDDDATGIAEGTISVFVRKVFTLNNISALKDLVLHMDYDDGFVAYLNGIEVARANLGNANTAVPYNQTADNYIEPFMTQGLAPEKFDIINFKDFVQEGDNILSIQVHNHSNTSSDITLIPFLSAGYSNSQEGNPVPEVLNLVNSKLHTNFKIASGGEILTLYNNNSELVDKVDSITLTPDISYGRITNDFEQWVYFSPSTPGETNANSGYTELMSSEVVFSKQGGKYSSQIQVALTSESGNNIYYTTDGTIPTQSSTLYTSPINISATTTIIANTFSDSSLSVSPTTQSYIISTRNINLPIVSITMNENDLWDYNTGIYVMGPNAESQNPYFGANFWMDWEKPCHIQYLNADGKQVYSTDCGTKIFGAWSRANDLKSMAFFARKEYGTKTFKFPFFTERPLLNYKSFVLRNSGNDINRSFFRDALMTSLMKDVDIERQAYQPAVVYLNSEYWGMLNMREKVNEDYLANNFNNVDADKVDILELGGDVVEGNSEHYMNLLSYLENNNISNEVVYDSVCKLIDVANFMEYQIAQIYYNNRDWPGNNIKFWRPQQAGGKWRWILYDTDFGFGIWGEEDYSLNTLLFALEAYNTEWPNPAWSTYLLRRLLQNTEFKKAFINRFADRLNYTFEPTKVNKLINEYSSRIQNEVQFHHNRWQNLWEFENQVQVMKTFANLRPNYMRTHINSKFSLNGTYNLTVNVSDKSAGTIQVNYLNLDVYPWSGKYFKNNAIRVQAIAYPGYEFSHWEGYDSKNPHIEKKFSSTTNLKAVFIESEREYSAIVINEINYKSDSLSDSGDWVELYNPNNYNIDISYYKLSNNNDTTAFKFSGGTTIPKNEYLVICRNSKKFSEVYPNVKNVIGELNYGLNSMNDMLLLYDPNNIIIDSVLYQNENPWPEIEKEQSIALINPFTDNSKGYRWESSGNLGTPGTHNDHFSAISKPKQITEIDASCFPNPANEQATIRWKVNKPQNVQINLYDIEGRLIKNVFNNYCPTGTFEGIWAPEHNSRAGIYLIQITYSQGLTKTLKLIKN